MSYSKVRGRSRETNAERIADRQNRSYKRELFRDCAREMRRARSLDEYKSAMRDLGYGVRETKKGLAYTVTNGRGQERTFTDRAMHPARLATADVRAAIDRNAGRELPRDRKPREMDPGIENRTHDEIVQPGQTQQAIERGLER